MKCRRCHRELSNPKSVQHGFGHVCWSKLQKLDYDERPVSLRITIIDSAEAQKSLMRMRELIKFAEVKTCKCGELLDPANLEYHDHEGGYDLPGFGQPQWLYHHCEKCNFDYSLWKLRIPEPDIAGNKLSQKILQKERDQDLTGQDEEVFQYGGED